MSSVVRRAETRIPERRPGRAAGTPRPVQLRAESGLAARIEAAAILVDSRAGPISPNGEALRVLLYPEQVPAKRQARRLAARRIRALFPSGPLSDHTPPVGEFLSGRRRYQYRICRFPSPLGGGRGPAALILLERLRPALSPAPAWLASFGLTNREEQVLRLVLQGLSNKQIAASMRISPNTVKAFLHLIMTKMRATSRFAIVGKMLGPPEG